MTMDDNTKEVAMELIGVIRGAVAGWLTLSFEMTEEDKAELNRLLWATGKEGKKDA